MTQLPVSHAGFFGNGQIVADAYRAPIGYEQVLPSTAKGLTAATYDGASYAVIQAEDQNVRWRDDGTDPTTSVGMVLAIGQQFAYYGDLSAIKFLEETATAKLNVSYYKI